MLEIGSLAPNFTLPDENNSSVTLSDYLGKKVLVYFYPRASTPGCTTQACALRDNKEDLAALNVVVLGISPDTPKKLTNFINKQELNFTLLSDEDHAVTEKYGAWDMKKFMGREFMGVLRSTFIIGKDGRIAYVMEKVKTKTHHEDTLIWVKENLS